MHKTKVGHYDFFSSLRLVEIVMTDFLYEKQRNRAFRILNNLMPSDGVVYVFYVRSRNRIKLMHWVHSSFVVHIKQMVQAG
ncbi:hypothetical protein [Prevotella jejuni]